MQAAVFELNSASRARPMQILLRREEVHAVFCSGQIACHLSTDGFQVDGRGWDKKLNQGRSTPALYM